MTQAWDFVDANVLWQHAIIRCDLKLSPEQIEELHRAWEKEPSTIVGAVVDRLTATDGD